MNTGSLNGYLFDHFPRKISAQAFVVEQAPEFLIRFLQLAAAEGIMKQVEPLIEQVKRTRRRFIQAAP